MRRNQSFKIAPKTIGIEDTLAAILFQGKAGKILLFKTYEKKFAEFPYL